MLERIDLYLPPEKERNFRDCVKAVLFSRIDFLVSRADLLHSMKSFKTRRNKMRQQKAALCKSTTVTGIFVATYLSFLDGWRFGDCGTRKRENICDITRSSGVRTREKGNLPQLYT